MISRELTSQEKQIAADLFNENAEKERLAKITAENEKFQADLKARQGETDQANAKLEGESDTHLTKHKEYQETLKKQLEKDELKLLDGDIESHVPTDK